MPDWPDAPGGLWWESLSREAVKKEAGKGSKKRTTGLRDLMVLREAWAKSLLAIFWGTFIIMWVVFLTAAEKGTDNSVDPWTLRALLLHSVTMFVVAATNIFK